MITLTEIQTRILEALAHYHYLTHSQMRQLQIGSPSFLRHSTRRLREKGDEPFIASIRYPFSPRQGRLEQVHHLTQAGATVLADIRNDDSIRTQFRPVTAIYHRDYWHRKFTIDFQIAMTRTVEAQENLELTLFDRYFDKTGNNRAGNPGSALRSQTRLDLDGEEHVIPDINLVLRPLLDSKRQILCTAEVANGQDTKRILRQIERHAAVLKKRALASHYGINEKAPHHVLFVFTDYGLLRAVRTRFVEVEAALEFSACFRFGYLPYLMQDVFRCWKMPSHVGEEWFHLITGKPVESNADRLPAS